MEPPGAPGGLPIGCQAAETLVATAQHLGSLGSLGSLGTSESSEVGIWKPMEFWFDDLSTFL